MNMNITFNINDMKTNINVNEYSTYYNKSLAYIPNSKMEERIKSWSNRLEGSEHRGCAINSLVFMGEMNIDRGIKEVKKIMLNQPYGTPYRHIVDWFNNRLSKQNRIFIEDYTIDINIDTIIKTFNNLPNDSMTIIKFNRNRDIARKHNLCPGHTVVISKDNNGNIYQIDPQKLTIYNLNNDKNILMQMYKEQFYSNVSIIIGYYLPKKIA